MELLSANAGQVFDRERIYELVWGLDSDGNSDTVMEHIRKYETSLLPCRVTAILKQFGGWATNGMDKNMSLKKSLFSLTFVNLLLAVILSAVVFWGCTKLSAALDPSGVQIVVGADAITKQNFQSQQPEQP